MRHSLPSRAPAFADFDAQELTSRHRRTAPVLAEGKRHCIPKGGILVVTHPMHRQIECLRGSLWITHDGDPRDVILGSKQYYRPDRDARMLIYALADAELSLIE